MSLLHRMLHRILRVGQRLRVNITPNHFYSDIPDLRALAAETYWRKPYASLDRVAGSDLRGQVAEAERICSPHRDLFRSAQLYHDAGAMNDEPGGFGEIEALFFYAYLLSHRPAKIVQIGCGVSTAVAIRAVKDTPGYTPSIVCIEPFPSTFLKQMHASGQIRHVPELAQKVPAEVLLDLRAGDLLFVDSTHTTKVGSEVVRIITDIMPRLPAGVRMHFHDISFPYDYGTGILDNAVFFWRESTLLYAYLLDNPRWRIDVSLSMLHHGAGDDLKRLIPAYHPRPVRDGLAVGSGHFPSSTYLVSCHANGSLGEGAQTI
jgi:Methyltransferase domain